jgi:hypothetical protein
MIELCFIMNMDQQINIQRLYIIDAVVILRLSGSSAAGTIRI